MYTAPIGCANHFFCNAIKRIDFCTINIFFYIFNYFNNIKETWYNNILKFAKS